ASALANALAAQDAGAAWLTVHARTKCEGYRPPAYWELLAPLNQALTIPLIANGEVWRPADALKCAQESGTPHLMIKLSAVTNPYLEQKNRRTHEATWKQVFPLLQEYSQTFLRTGLPKQEAGRIKQLLNYLRSQWPVAETLYQEQKKERS